MISSRMISFQKVVVKSRQPSGSASLPDPVALETKEQTLEREQNEVMFLKHWVTDTSVTPACLSRMCLRLIK
jgi:hypothetical protein